MQNQSITHRDHNKEIKKVHELYPEKWYVVRYGVQILFLIHRFYTFILTHINICFFSLLYDHCDSSGYFHHLIANQVHTHKSKSKRKKKMVHSPVSKFRIDSF